MIAREIPLLRRAFYFLRHGETESNLDGTIAGTRDVALTRRGHEQARAAAAVLRDRGVTAIYSSALRRARETADHVARSLGLAVDIIPELGERDWGELEGKPRALRKPGVTSFGAESPDVFQERVRRGLCQIAPSAAPLIVSHSGVFRVLCATLQVPDPGSQLANAQTVRFAPAAEGAAWTLELIR